MSSNQTFHRKSNSQWICHQDIYHFLERHETMNCHKCFFTHSQSFWYTERNNIKWLMLSFVRLVLLFPFFDLNVHFLYFILLYFFSGIFYKLQKFFFPFVSITIWYYSDYLLRPISSYDILSPQSCTFFMSNASVLKQIRKFLFSFIFFLFSFLLKWKKIQFLSDMSKQSSNGSLISFFFYFHISFDFLTQNRIKFMKDFIRTITSIVADLWQ